ncbi:MAG: cupin domain-containing protein [Chloroflexi bacterium]|nr:cupin domain-containing protein [Chloroflexota bacterium]
MECKRVHASQVPVEVGPNAFAKLLRESGDNIRRDVFTLLRPEETESGALLAGYTIVYPGCTTKGHTHPDREEVYYFVRGRGVMIADGKETDVAAGDMYYLPFGPLHTTRNPNDVPLEFFWVVIQKH